MRFEFVFLMWKHFNKTSEFHLFIYINIIILLSCVYVDWAEGGILISSTGSPCIFKSRTCFQRYFQKCIKKSFFYLVIFFLFLLFTKFTWLRSRSPWQRCCHDCVSYTSSWGSRHWGPSPAASLPGRTARRRGPGWCCPRWSPCTGSCSRSTTSHHPPRTWRAQRKRLRQRKVVKGI